MDNIAENFDNKITIQKLDEKTDMKVFEFLSDLDKKCVGAEGWSAESFRSEAQKDNGIVICAHEDSRIIGLICGFFAADEAEITSVAVDNNYRRRGIGDRLMKAFTECLPQSTISIFLEVRESNSPAVSLYEKHGFASVGMRKNFYCAPVENAILMKKEL